jgi:hypothetical protein
LDDVEQKEEDEGSEDVHLKQKYLKLKDDYYSLAFFAFYLDKEDTVTAKIDEIKLKDLLQTITINEVTENSTADAKNMADAIKGTFRLKNNQR